MRRFEYTEVSEQEIVELINSEYPDVGFDSIVAAEELGNHNWDVEVDLPEDYDRKVVENVTSKRVDYRWSTGSFLNMLCEKGKLPAGKYIIDCTW